MMLHFLPCRRSLIWAAFLLIASTLTANTALKPTLRPDFSAEHQARWMGRHQANLERAKKGDVDVLFMGDSITEYWATHGRESWDLHFAPLKAANFGIAGDRIQQVLWRMENGELDGIRPKVVVLLIGTNNTSLGLGGKNSLTQPNTTPEIIEGVAAVVNRFHAKVPGVKILLLGIFPRGERGDPRRDQIKEINTGLSQLHNGRNVVFLDLGAKLLEPDGHVSQEIMSDALHLKPAGYKIWAETIKEPVLQLLQASP